MDRRQVLGHIAAIATILVWGTTFVSTKVLLQSFSPIETLVFRFALGYVALSCACPRPLKPVSLRQEAVFALAGFTGVCLYYILENVALTMTFASNVSVIVSCAPLFTALFAIALSKVRARKNPNENVADSHLRPTFAIGFVLAIVGISMISFNGTNFSLNPAGDLLALAAAAAWGVYTVVTDRIWDMGVGTIQATRRIFFYGLLFMIPIAIAGGFHLGIERFYDPLNTLNMLFLGVGASAACFSTWNFAVKAAGAVETSVYIYLTPVIAVAASAIVLHEPLSALVIVGTILTLVGMIVSQRH